MSDQRRQRIGNQFDEIDEYKKRIAAMQHIIGTHADVSGQGDEIIRRQKELEEQLSEAIRLQTGVLEMEYDINHRQNQLNDRLDDAMDGQDDIADIQNQLTGELRDVRFTQGVVMGRAREMMDRQDEVPPGRTSSAARACWRELVSARLHLARASTKPAASRRASSAVVPPTSDVVCDWGAVCC